MPESKNLLWEWDKNVWCADSHARHFLSNSCGRFLVAFGRSFFWQNLVNHVFKSVKSVESFKTTGRPCKSRTVNSTGWIICVGYRKSEYKLIFIHQENMRKYVPVLPPFVVARLFAIAVALLVRMQDP